MGGEGIMFRVKVYMNGDKIDEIRALNLGRARPESRPDERKYEVKTKKGFFDIYHNREEGWEVLLIKILKRMRGEING